MEINVEEIKRAAWIRVISEDSWFKKRIIRGSRKDRRSIPR